MRREVRRSYACPCEGESWPPGREVGHPIGGAAVGSLVAIGRLLGREPPECPWNSWADSDVATIVDAWAWYDKGQLETLLGDDPPQWILDGVREFARALDLSRADVMDQERKAREASRAH